jgi:hypothetical protein
MASSTFQLETHKPRVIRKNILRRLKRKFLSKCSTPPRKKFLVTPMGIQGALYNMHFTVHYIL